MGVNVKAACVAGLLLLLGVLHSSEAVCYCVTGDGVNVRRHPSLSADVLGMMYKGNRECYWGRGTVYRDRLRWRSIQWNKLGVRWAWAADKFLRRDSSWKC